MKILKMFEVEAQTFLYLRGAWRNGATLDTMVQMVDYNAAGDIASLHLGWTNLMKNITGVLQKMLCIGIEKLKAVKKRALWRPEEKIVS